MANCWVWIREEEEAAVQAAHIECISISFIETDATALSEVAGYQSVKERASRLQLESQIIDIRYYHFQFYYED